MKVEEEEERRGILGMDFFEEGREQISEEFGVRVRRVLRYFGIVYRIMSGGEAREWLITNLYTFFQW